MNEITKYHGLYKPPTKNFRPEKIIFLDIDGVLINRKILEQKNESMLADKYHDFDKDSLKYLENIVEITDAYIVISSTWRKRDINWMRNIFKTRGFKFYNKIIGETCRGYHFKTNEYSTITFYRGNEIDAWIRLFIEKDNEDNYISNVKYHYVIIDDDTDMLYWQRNNFIKINGENGLTEENARDAVKILKGFKIEE